MLYPLCRLAISAAGSCGTANTQSNASWKTLCIQDRGVRLQHLVNGGSHAVLVMMQRDRPAILFQIVRRISHDHRMAGKGQHVNVIVIVADGHDLAAIDAPVVGPTLQSVSLRASG